MNRQYGAQRFQPWFPLREVPHTVGKGKRQRTVTKYEAYPGDIGRKYQVGIVPVGTLFRLRNDKSLYIVQEWLNRQYLPCVRGAREVTYMRGGHLAQVKNLRNGQVSLLADHHIRVD
jgi:hypothetical protein